MIDREQRIRRRSALRASPKRKIGSILMNSTPQRMEKRIGKQIFKEKENGIGTKAKEYIQAWKMIRKEDFINKGVYLKFKDKNSQQKQKERKILSQFKGIFEEKQAYQQMLKEELEKVIVTSIQQNQVKWWNHTFLIKKPNVTWRKILDAIKLNKEIKKLLFKKYSLEEEQYLANQMDYATSLDLKSAFHLISVSSNSIPYLVFNFNIY
ncbi:MAG: hypothetical protein EZS28_016193 [Streblomastix strix]|uniref:Reverse transcriptase domain-containing protein n=1 Tax=Streblomastix strix TaxID=222440 RepID=A0A5J4W166_9EUKA|nr:MAG: hypothetical protein EZS28_016193 [Streblomastix strix]